MATGRKNYLTNQNGQDIVVAELSRRGFKATTTAGKVPSHIAVAVDDHGGPALVRVKATTADKWQLNVGQFADVAFEGQKQVIKRQLDDPYSGLVCVMVQIAPPDSGRPDRFFVLPWRELARIVIAGHSEWLAKHGGVRPRNPKSLHAAVHPEELGDWENQWQVLTKRVRPMLSQQGAAADEPPSA